MDLSLLEQNVCMFYSLHSKSRGEFQNVIEITEDLDMFFMDGYFSILAM